MAHLIPCRIWAINRLDSDTGVRTFPKIRSDLDSFTGIPVACVVQPSNCYRFVPIINIALLEKYHGKFKFCWTKFCKWQMIIECVSKLGESKKAPLEKVSLNQISMRPMDLRWFRSRILRHTEKTLGWSPSTLESLDQGLKMTHVLSSLRNGIW